MAVVSCKGVPHAIADRICRRTLFRDFGRTRVCYVASKCPAHDFGKLVLTELDHSSAFAYIKAVTTGSTPTVSKETRHLLDDDALLPGCRIMCCDVLYHMWTARSVTNHRSAGCIR
jgi:hypothetical protein